jgi:hypothetical protein
MLASGRYLFLDHEKMLKGKFNLDLLTDLSDQSLQLMLEQVECAFKQQPFPMKQNR